MHEIMKMRLTRKEGGEARGLFSRRYGNLNPLS
jgi:hypothetical protein